MAGGEFILQMIRVVAGFIAAIGAAGLFLSWGLFQDHQPGHVLEAAALVWVGMATISLIGAAAFIPAMIAIAIAEMTGLRSAVFHIGAGGAIAFSLWTLEGTAGDGLRTGSEIAAACGFLGGFLYWLLAGRYAGRWRRRADPPANL